MDVAAGPHTRLVRWRMRNFKSVRECSVELGGLTLLVGANSAGKSSLIQSILLFKQAQGARQERPENFPLNGALVRLGSFSEVLNAQCDARTGTLELGGTLANLEPLDEVRVGDLDPPSPHLSGRMAHAAVWSVDWSTEFEAPDREDLGRMRVRRATLEGWHSAADEVEGIDDEARLIKIELRRDARRARWAGRTMPVLATPAYRDRQWAFRDYRGVAEERLGSTSRTLTLQAGSPGAGLPRMILQSKRLSSILFDPRAQGLPARLVQNLNEMRRAFRGIQPRARRGSLARGTDSDVVADLVERIEGQVLVYRVQSSGAPPGPDYGQAAQRLNQGLSEVVRPLVHSVSPGDYAVVRKAPSALRAQGVELSVLVDPHVVDSNKAAGSVSTFLRESVTYLGPLRSTPRSLPRSYDAQDGVGVEGEFTAAVLHAEKDMIVLDWDPARGRAVRRTLLDAVSRWLKLLLIADEVRSEDRGRDGIEILVKPVGVDRFLNLRNVGVGTNQVLPVVILCLRSNPGSLVLLEQPELHLHPSAQQALADFFICMTRSGRQLIVETHGEHLVSRLRRRIAEDRESVLLDDLTLLFAERTPKSGVTTYRSVEPNEFGGIHDWPKGFFDQAATEAALILQAAVRKRDADDA